VEDGVVVAVEDVENVKEFDVGSVDVLVEEAAALVGVDVNASGEVIVLVEVVLKVNVVEIGVSLEVVDALIEVDERVVVMVVLVDVVVEDEEVVLVVVVVIVRVFIGASCLMSMLTTGTAGKDPPRNCAYKYASLISLSVSARSHITNKASRIFPYLESVYQRAICGAGMIILGGAPSTVEVPHGTLFLNNSSFIDAPFFAWRIDHTAHSSCTIRPLLFEMSMLVPR
jgi:hypothetical protein